YATTSANYNVSYPKDGPSRGEVFGVERLDLSISESLIVKALRSTTNQNYSQTSFNEGTSDRYFAYVELRNQSPFDVDFDSKEAWKIVLRQDQAVSPAGVPKPMWERRLSLKTGTIPVVGTATNPNPYVIGSSDSNSASSPAAVSRSSFAVSKTSTNMAS